MIFLFKVIYIYSPRDNCRVEARFRNKTFRLSTEVLVNIRKYFRLGIQLELVKQLLKEHPEPKNLEISVRTASMLFGSHLKVRNKIYDTFHNVLH